MPHWYAVASVKWLKRIDVLTEPFAGEFQTGHYVYDGPTARTSPSRLMRVRARITDPSPGDVIGRGTHTVRGKAWSGTGPVTRSTSASPAKATGTRPSWSAQRPLPMAGLDLRLGRDRRRTAFHPRPSHRRRRQRPTRSPALEPARLRQQRHRGLLRRRVLIPNLDDLLHAQLDVLINHIRTREDNAFEQGQRPNSSTDSLPAWRP